MPQVYAGQWTSDLANGLANTFSDPELTLNSGVIYGPAPGG